jgi:hypothetical protein
MITVCPISAIILMTSKLEAILDFWRGYFKTAPNEMGGGVVREEGSGAGKPAAPLIAFGGGGGGEGDGQTCPCN